MTSLRLLTLIVALFSAASAAAEADDAPVLTKSQWMDKPGQDKPQGGEPFQVECGRGSYLSGFEGRAGAWINHLRIVCARWNAARGKLEQPVVVEERQIGQSQGGEPTRETCPIGLAIGDPYDDVYARDDDAFVLHSVEFHCLEAAAGFRPLWRKFGSTSPTNSDTPWWEARFQTKGCPVGYLATGVHGRSGEFIDTLGFVCRPRPKASAVSFPKPIGGVRQPDNPRFSKLQSGVNQPDNPRFSTRKSGINASGETVPPPPPPPPAKPTATAIADVDIYDGPGGQFNVTGTLGKDSTVPVLGHNADKDWYQLQIGNGSGWVAADWLTIKP